MPVVFDEKRASTYDERADTLAPMRDALYLCMRLILSELPSDARVLCVGVGTGSELLFLAQAFPGWQFTLVEPAPAMLNLCRQKAEGTGIAHRCTFHEGYLDTLPNSDGFHGATCLLVSHFFLQADERSRFFGQIAARLLPGGLLVSSDLASDRQPAEYQSLRHVWRRMLEYGGYSPEDVEKFLAAHGTQVAVLPTRDVETILRDGGFESPVLFLQTLFIHAWFAKRQ